ncbi:MAG: hypothetical protein IJP89_00435 [Synergistaceae bacterium]|nr:hypothetical protein [Synergistaceae bacterium]
MRRVVYLGYSDKMIRALSESNDYSLEHVVGVKGRLSAKYYSEIESRQIPFTEITSKNELLSNAQILDKADVVIMHKFEFIIPPELTSKHRFFNFHGGSLSTNRGAHAPVWSVLLREKETSMSCYEIMPSGEGGIDEGMLIAEYTVNIERTDSPIDVDNKLAEGIPQLLSAMSDYLDGKRKATPATGGTYRRKIEKRDFTIDLHADSFDTIRGKVLSQLPYFGAVINIDGHELRTKSYELNEDGRIITFAGDKVIISGKEGVMTLSLYDKSDRQ